MECSECGHLSLTGVTCTYIVLPDCRALLLPILNMFMNSSRTTSSFVALLSRPLVGTPECVSYVILCCIYVAGVLGSDVLG